jgi:acyl-CoA hydrolase
VFIGLLRAHPGAAAGVEIWSCLIPGINTFDYGSLPDGPQLVAFMASPALAPSIATGRTRLRAMPYSEIGALLTQTEFDLAILHAAAPDANGLCSFGIACDAPGIVWPRSAKRIVFLNEQMPQIVDAEAIHQERIDLAIPIDAPLLSAEAGGARSPMLDAIAGRAAGLVHDGATIQSGIGEAPGAVIAALRDHRRLSVHSGIITSDYRLLAESGALDRQASHVAGIAWGDRAFYRWLADTRLFGFRSILETHAHGKLAAIPGFVSIGSALEVDLAGNINLEWLDGRRVSSVGGAPDYMRGAAGSRGGRSIIALPSTSRGGASRIVSLLGKPSISGSLADAIITEHGVAELRGLSPEARAQVLIAIAAPEHRAALSAAMR